MMVRGKNQHVLQHRDGWAVKGAGNNRATESYLLKKRRLKLLKALQKTSIQTPKFMGKMGRYVQVTATVETHFLPKTENRYLLSRYKKTKKQNNNLHKNAA